MSTPPKKKAKAAPKQPAALKPPSKGKPRGKTGGTSPRKKAPKEGGGKAKGKAAETPADDCALRNEKKELFLEKLAELGNISAAARAAECGRSSHRYWLANDPSYKARVRDAMRDAAGALEAEARRRAAQGVRKPVFHKGEKVATVREYSDTLLIFLLKGAMPKKYRERQEVKVSGTVATGPPMGDRGGLYKGLCERAQADLAKEN